MRLIPHLDTGVVHLSGLSISLSNLVLTQLSISYHFLSLCYDSAVTRLTTLRSGGEHSTFTLPVGKLV